MSTRFISPQDPTRELIDGVDINLNDRWMAGYTAQPLFKILDLPEECSCDEFNREERKYSNVPWVGTCGPDSDCYFRFNPALPAEKLEESWLKTGCLVPACTLH